MKQLQKAYYYFFYKIYKFIEYTSEKFGGGFWSEYKAGLAVIALEIWMFFSLAFYITAFSRRRIEFDEIWFITWTLIVCAVNYFFFIHSDKKNEYFKGFEKLPKTRNAQGSWIVALLVLFIVVNSVLSVYLLLTIK